MVLALTFRALIALIAIWFEINLYDLRYMIWDKFYILCEAGVQPHSSVSGYPVVPAQFVEKPAFSPLNGLGTLVKNQLVINIRTYIWILNSIPSFSISILMPVPRFLDYCSFVIRLEIAKCESSTLFFFKVISAICILLRFHMNFRISLSILKAAGILTPIGLNS